eukprot:5671091-Lingulodinium_polyedra.AAC.1
MQPRAQSTRWHLPHQRRRGHHARVHVPESGSRMTEAFWHGGSWHATPAWPRHPPGSLQEFRRP